MSTDKVVEITKIIETLARGLDSLAEAGAGMPAVTKNAARMRGTLQALESQFIDLLPNRDG